jgi:phage/plasmid-like protein (TIGR03299 family)
VISLKGGALINALVWLDEPVNIAGDDSPTFPFLSLSNAHDGSAALRALFTAIRIVCWNTYSAALASAERDKSLYTFRHVGNVAERIEEAKAVLMNLRADNAEWVELANDLFKLPAREEEVKTFTELFLPTPPAGTYSDRVAANIDRDRGIFTKLYNESYTTEGHRGTALGLVDAAVEYLDHVRGFRNADTKFGRSLLRSEPLKAKAVSIVREVCGAGAN